MKFVSFSACTGWYWVTMGGKHTTPVAGWAVTESGEVVGMVATGVQSDGTTPKLNPPTGGYGGGRYVQEQQLNEAARAELKRPVI